MGKRLIAEYLTFLLRKINLRISPNTARSKMINEERRGKKEEGRGKREERRGKNEEGRG